MRRKINLILLKPSAKLRKVRVFAELRVFSNLGVLYAQVYVLPQNPWHKGEGKVLAGYCRGNKVIGGFMKCILYKPNYAGRNEKNYMIKFTQPDTSLRYWFGVADVFIRTKGVVSADVHGLRYIVSTAARTERQEQKEDVQAAETNVVDAVLRVNDPLPLPGVAPMPLPPPLSNVNNPFNQQSVTGDDVQQQFMQSNNNGNYPWNVPHGQVGNDNDNSANIGPTQSNAGQVIFDVNAFNGKSFRPSVIRDFGLFIAVILSVFDSVGKRIGSAALASKINMKTATVDKHLRFVMAMINKGVRFSQIANQSQNLNEFSTETLGYASYAGVTAANSGNGYSSMTTEQVRQLLS